MFVRAVFEGIRSGVCEWVYRKRLVILKQERKSLLKKVPGTFSLPWLNEDKPTTYGKAIAVESKLFSYPVGWSKKTINKNSIWNGSASPRFIKWFNQYESPREDEERHEKLNCLCCKMQKEWPRRCPICDHVFQGNGWDGIDAHWRAKHEDIMPYEKFWESLCSEHRS